MVPLSLTHTHINNPTLRHTYTHIHTRTHKHTYMHTHTHTHSLTHSQYIKYFHRIYSNATNALRVLFSLPNSHYAPNQPIFQAYYRN